MSIIVILGPTCSWKSETAILVAEQIGAEIISCDSMQIYRGLEIGTAQPSTSDMSRVPHHLIAQLDIHEQYDVNRFLELAKKKIAEIKSGGKQVVIVGGTGLYARSLVYGHSLLPSNPELALQIQNELAEPNGKSKLEKEIINAANGKENVPPDVLLNPRRLTRACEILRLTQKLPWKLQENNKQPSPEYTQFTILPTLDLLRQRIPVRTHKMMAAGWLQEAQHAIGCGLMTTPTARQALGYREIDDFLSGRSLATTQEELEELLALRTVQYARRQLTWFKHQHNGAIQLPIQESNMPSNIASVLYAQIIDAINKK